MATPTGLAATGTTVPAPSRLSPTAHQDSLAFTSCRTATAASTWTSTATAPATTPPWCSGTTRALSSISSGDSTRWHRVSTPFSRRLWRTAVSTLPTSLQRTRHRCCCGTTGEATTSSSLPTTRATATISSSHATAARLSRCPAHQPPAASGCASGTTTAHTHSSGSSRTCRKPLPTLPTPTSLPLTATSSYGATSSTPTLWAPTGT